MADGSPSWWPSHNCHYPSFFSLRISVWNRLMIPVEELGLSEHDAPFRGQDSHFLNSILVQHGHSTEHGHPGKRAMRETSNLCSGSTFLVPCSAFQLLWNSVFLWNTPDSVMNWTENYLFTTNGCDLIQALIRNHFQSLPFWEIKFGVW